MKRLLKKYTVLLLGGGLITFSACAETPEEVNREIAILDNEQYESEIHISEASYATIAEIRQSMDTVLQVNQSNIQIIGKPVIPNSVAMPVYDVSAYMASDAECEDLFQNLLVASCNDTLLKIAEKAEVYDASFPIETIFREGDGINNGTNISDRKWIVNARGINLVAEDGTSSLGVATNGFLCNYFKDFGNPPIYVSNCPIAEIIPVSYEKLETVQSYPMQNGVVWEIEDAVSFVEEFYNQSFSELPGQYSYRVSEIIVRSLEKGGYGYDFTMQRMLPDGNSILPISFLNYNSEDDDYTSILAGSAGSVWCLQADQIQEFNHNSIYQMTVVNDQKILIPSVAIQIVADALAQQQVHTVYVELGYLYQVNNSEYLAVTQNEYVWGTAIENEDYITAQAVPFWMFYEPIEGAKPRTSGTYYLVNALTGELEIR